MYSFCRYILYGKSYARENKTYRGCDEIEKLYHAGIR